MEYLHVSTYYLGCQTNILDQMRNEPHTPMDATNPVTEIACMFHLSENLKWHLLVVRKGIAERLHSFPLNSCHYQ